MNKFDDGDLTYFEKEKIYVMDYSEGDEYLKGIEYIDELAENNFFLNKLKDYIKTNKARLLFDADIDNVDNIIEFIKSAYEKQGVKEKENNKAVFTKIKNWINGIIPNVKSREEFFRFCLCMRMNEVETTEFLLKGCLMKPFNFKDVSEIVYYFCLKNNKSYADVVRIIEAIKNADETENQFAENDTAQIANQISKITDEKELIDYICYNKSGFEKQNQTAITMLSDLIERSVEFAEYERSCFKRDNSGVEPITSSQDIASILNVVLGFGARTTVNGKDAYKQKITDSNFPKLIKDNFPQPQQIQTILKTKSGSAEMIRKSIILFTFYNMFAELKKENIDLENHSCFDEFTDEVDVALLSCGYVQMYFRNPYDWMFGFCAASNEPLDALREIISICYTDVDEFYTER